MIIAIASKNSISVRTPPGSWAGPHVLYIMLYLLPPGSWAGPHVLYTYIVNICYPQVVGLAPVSGMCRPAASCTVNEGRHFESVYVMAHEIGHK